MQVVFVRRFQLLEFQRSPLNPSRPSQNVRHFTDDTLNRNFLNANFRISIKISLKLAPKGSIKNIPALVQIMAWRRPGDKPLSEQMMVSLLTRHVGAAIHRSSGETNQYKIDTIFTPIILPKPAHILMAVANFINTG